MTTILQAVKDSQHSYEWYIDRKCPDQYDYRYPPPADCNKQQGRCDALCINCWMRKWKGDYE